MYVRNKLIRIINFDYVMNYDLWNEAPVARRLILHPVLVSYNNNISRAFLFSFSMVIKK